MMTREIIIVSSYFDGEDHHNQGPYTVLIEKDVILDVIKGDGSASPSLVPESFRRSDSEVTRAGFLMPGLVEAHCHLFLDGNELDFKVRKDYLKSDHEHKVETGRRQVRQTLSQGITMIRDAGDMHGVNHQLREDSRQSNEILPVIRSPGQAIRRPGRYGGFMAEEVETSKNIMDAVMNRMQDSDDMKVILTGIIDFEKGIVKGKPQFNVEEARMIVECSEKHGRLTYAHCSGVDGLETATASGIHSVEHGFFMNKESLVKMADKGITWVPTFSPVYFQWEHPEHAGWNEVSIAKLKEILDNHYEHIAIGEELGVQILAGSDAGSYGVPHGQALIDELMHFKTAGMSTKNILRSATSRPRGIWKCESANIEKGNVANMVLYSQSPFESFENIRNPMSIFKAGWVPLNEPAAIQSTP